MSSNPIAQEADWIVTLLEPDLEAEPELSRLTLVVGELNIDVGLPAHVSIAQYIPDVIDIANEQITANEAIVEFAAADGQWTLAPLGGEPIAPHLSLGEAGVYDGDLLMICAAGQPVSPLLFDDVDDTQNPAAGAGAVRSWFTDNANVLAGFGVTAAAAVTLAGVLARWAVQPAVPAAVLALGATGVLLACLVAHRPAATGTSAWTAAVSMPLVFAGSLYLVPDGSGATSLPMSFALTAFGALLVLLVSGSGSAVYTAIIAACTFGGVSSTAMLLWQPPIRTVGALLATTAVIVVYLAPRVTIGLSKLPIPRVPTAGEPLDDIETQGGTTVEGVNAIGKQIIPTEEDLISRVRRANQHLTGILVAAALAALVGCYLAVDVSNGFYWQGTVFAMMVATVLCLRGRGHHDLVQSATLIGSGLTIAVTVVLKTAVYVEGWQARAVVVLLALMVLILTCGLVAPLREFSPVMRRQVEILEYIAVGSLFPLCFWIIRVYAFFREMRL
ncbi:type VII secretion integral membrane protein EccD [Mycolicibacterium septicum]|uniref:type VII secretion integral membrane protein EccD n=1 Tax=Mycolicibacterium septicum TaxID=98668 RepID=UPI0023E0CE56|nr:type VII secretion integral membrane protein EccD [Mycolicibacterium septicum]MDF3340294.1 type VII secretion integral membrane protein EccD [Mycolicibacterium septicum]